jgi:hypothetical protein
MCDFHFSEYTMQNVRFSSILASIAFAIFRIKSPGNFGSCYIDLTVGGESEMKL